MALAQWDGMVRISEEWLRLRMMVVKLDHGYPAIIYTRATMVIQWIAGIQGHQLVDPFFQLKSYRG